MFANLAGTGAPAFCRYVSSASRADITGDGKVSSLAPDPSTPQVPPAREGWNQKRRKENRKTKERKENQKTEKPENYSAHDSMRTWLYSALSSPARHQGLSHVQQNYTDMPQRGNSMVPSASIRTNRYGRRSKQSFPQCEVLLLQRIKIWLDHNLSRITQMISLGASTSMVRALWLWGCPVKDNRNMWIKGRCALAVRYMSSSLL